MVKYNSNLVCSLPDIQAPAQSYLDKRSRSYIDLHDSILNLCTYTLFSWATQHNNVCIDLAARRENIVYL